MYKRQDIEGDNDPVDICVLTEKDITHGDIIVKARPIGGFRLLDHNKADDKLIAVLENDAIYGAYKDISDVPPMVIDRDVYKRQPETCIANRGSFLPGKFSSTKPFTAVNLSSYADTSAYLVDTS